MAPSGCRPEPGIGADAQERLLRGTKIPDAVVEDSDHVLPYNRPGRRDAHCPLSGPASRSARPTPLKDASSTWWGFRRAQLDVQRERCRVREGGARTPRSAGPRTEGCRAMKSHRAQRRSAGTAFQTGPARPPPAASSSAARSTRKRRIPAFRAECLGQSLTRTMPVSSTCGARRLRGRPRD